MRNIFKSLALVAAASLMFAACNKEAPSKAEVESGFKTLSGKLPTLSLGSDVACDALNGVATLNLNITGLDENLDSLTIGILSSTDESFAVTKYMAIESPVEGDNTATASVTANKTYYLKGVAASTLGTVYTEAIKVDVPDIPFWAKIPGKWSCHIVSEQYGDEYDNTMTIIADTENPQNYCILAHLEPYYNDRYGASYGYPKYFWCSAKIDNDKNTITVSPGATYNYSGRSIAGLNSASMETATAYSDLVFSFVDDDTLLQENAFQTLDGNNDPEDSYVGNVVYTRN